MKYQSLLILALCIVTQGHCKPPSVRATPADTIKVAMFRKMTERFRVAQPDSAVYYAKQGIALASRVKDDKGKALLLEELGNVYASHNSYDLAEQYFIRSLTLFTGLKEDAAEAEVYASLGAVQSKRGHHKEAIRQLQHSLQLYQSHRDTAGEIRTLLTLGKTCEAAGMYPRALDEYEKADKLNRNRPFSILSLRILQHKGAYYERTGNFGKALEIFRQGITQSQAAGYTDINIHLLNKAGVAASKLGDSATAIQFHREGMAKAKSSGLAEEQVISMLNMANMLKENFAEESLEHLHNALDISHKLGNRQLVAEVYKSMASVYRQQNDYKEALYALEQHHKLMDSVLMANNAREEAGLRHLFELDEYKLSVQQKTFQRNIGLVVIAALLVLLIVVLLNFRRTRSLNKQLTQSNKIKDILFSILGHDMRGPLNVVEQGLLIAEDMPADEQKAFIPLITRNVQTVNGIVNSLFEWSKTQQKNLQIQPERFSPEQIVHNNTALLTGQAAAKSIAININISQGIRVLADPNQFGVIIRNLLSNAIKFSHEHSKVEVNAAEEDDRVVFSVSDQGVGIPENRVKNFFSELVVTFGTAGETGTGIGLQLTKEFVAANKGAIWVESEEGNGSTFYFSLPGGK